MNGKSDTMGGDATKSAGLSHNDVAHSPAAAAPKVAPSLDIHSMRGEDTRYILSISFRSIPAPAILSIIAQQCAFTAITAITK